MTAPGGTGATPLWRRYLEQLIERGELAESYERFGTTRGEVVAALWLGDAQYRSKYFWDKHLWSLEACAVAPEHHGVDEVGVIAAALGLFDKRFGLLGDRACLLDDNFAPVPEKEAEEAGDPARDDFTRELEQLGLPGVDIEALIGGGAIGLHESVLRSGRLELDVMYADGTLRTEVYLVPEPAPEVADDYHAAKSDKGKARFSLLPLDAVMAVVGVLECGARKYSAHSWQGVPDARERYFDALMRHLVASRSGGAKDPETGLSHLAHAACNALFLVALEIRGESGE